MGMRAMNTGVVIFNGVVELNNAVTNLVRNTVEQHVRLWLPVVLSFTHVRLRYYNRVGRTVMHHLRVLHDLDYVNLQDGAITGLWLIAADGL